MRRPRGCIGVVCVVIILSAGEEGLTGSGVGTGAPVLSLAVSEGTGVVAAGTELVGSVARVVIWYGYPPVSLLLPREIPSPPPPSPEKPPSPKPERISEAYRDLRTAGVKAQYTESHNDDITALSFHPTVPHLLLSGATDALVNIYNLLAPPSTTTTDTDDDAALHQVINHGSSIHRAGFLGTNVYALSHDEQLAVYAVVEEVPEDTERAPETAECKQWGDVRGLLGCEYVVDIMEDSSGGVVVAGSHSEHWVDLVPLRKTDAGIEGWSMLHGEGVRLHEGHGGEVVRGVWVDEGVSTGPSPTSTTAPTPPWTTANRSHCRRAQSTRRARTAWSRPGGHRRWRWWKWWKWRRSGRSARRRSAESAGRRRKQKHGTARISNLVCRNAIYKYKCKYK